MKTTAKTKQTTGITGEQTGRPKGKTGYEPTANGTRGLTKRGTVEPEPAGPDEKLPNLLGGTTTGLGQTGETVTGQAKLPTGLKRAGETETGQAKLPDKTGRETTTELDAPTELGLDTTAGTAIGLETTDDTATGRAATGPDEAATVQV